jgi:SAM-dependent methyltransferase
VAVDVARWNHNIHYHPLILPAAARPGCQRALDVGCGEGILARELRRLVPHVSAIVDEPSVELARRYAGSDVEYIVGDFLSYPFPSGSFDLVASVAALHHMDTALALDRMRGLVRPGGQLVVVGLARSRYPADLPRDLVAAVTHRLHRLTKPYWEHSAPKVWPSRAVEAFRPITCGARDRSLPYGRIRPDREGRRNYATQRLGISRAAGGCRARHCRLRSGRHGPCGEGVAERVACATEHFVAPPHVGGAHHEQARRADDVAPCRSEDDQRPGAKAGN